MHALVTGLIGLALIDQSSPSGPGRIPVVDPRSAR